MKKYVCVLAIIQIIIMSHIAYAAPLMDLSHVFIDETTADVDAPWVYSVQYKVFDADSLCAALLGSAYQYDRNDAFGVWYAVQRDSHTSMLGVFDPDKATSNSTGQDGGFAYLNLYDGLSYYEFLGSILDLQPGYQHENLWEENLNAELSFGDLSEVLSSVDETLRQVGLDSFCSVSSYAFKKEYVIDKIEADIAADIAKIERYDQLMSDCYILFYQQFINGLPVNDVHWTNKIRHQGDPLETYAVVIVSPTGIEAMYVYSAYDVFETEYHNTEYGWEDALEIIDAKLSKGLTCDVLQVERITKMLYPTGNTNTGLILRPVWHITAITSAQEYKYYIIDAITLEMFE